MADNIYFDQKMIDKYYPTAHMIPPMKIGTFPNTRGITIQDVCSSNKYFANIKKDGAMYIYDKGTDGHSYLFGRTVSKATGLLTEKGANVPHIMKYLDGFCPDNTVLVGEIYYHGGTSKDTTKIMGCKPEKAIERQGKDHKIIYYIHDILMYNGESYLNTPAFKRYCALTRYIMAPDKPDFIEYAGYYDADNYDLLKLAEELIHNGEEGLVLKDKDGLYYPGQRPAWNMIKLKRHDTVDVVGMDPVPATKLYEGKDVETWQYNVDKHDRRLVGSYLALSLKGLHPIAVTKPYYYGWSMGIDIGLYDKDGELKRIGSVSSGFDDSDRAHMDKYIGKVLELGVMQKDNKAQTLRHPVFIRGRDDKNATDCTFSETFN